MKIAIIFQVRKKISQNDENTAIPVNDGIRIKKSDSDVLTAEINSASKNLQTHNNFNLSKLKLWDQISQHEFVGNGLFKSKNSLLENIENANTVEELFEIAKKLEHKDIDQAGQILLGIVLSVKPSFQKVGQIEQIQSTVQDQVKAYKLLLSLDCSQKNQAYIAMVYQTGTFRSASDIIYAANAIETFSGHKLVRKSVFIDEALYSLAVMHNEEAKRLGIPAKNTVEAAFQLIEFENGLNSEERQLLIHKNRKNHVLQFVSQELEKAMIDSSTFEEMAECAALYAKTAFVIRDEKYQSIIFDSNANPLERNNDFLYAAGSAKNGWARLLLLKLKVQEFKSVEQIQILCSEFLNEGIYTNELYEDCLLILITQMIAPMDQIELALKTLSDISGNRFDLKNLLSFVDLSDGVTYLILVKLFLKINPQLNNGYVQQFAHDGQDFGTKIETAESEPWGHFFQVLIEMGLLTNKTEVSLLCYAIHETIPDDQNVKSDLLFSVAMDQKNSFANRVDCYHVLQEIDCDFQYLVFESLKEDLKKSHEEITKKIDSFYNTIPQNAVQSVNSDGQIDRAMLAELRKERADLFALLDSLNHPSAS